MIKNSILNKISAIFFLSLFLLAMFFALLLEHQSDKNLDNMKQRQIQSVNYLLVMYRNNVEPGDIEEYFNNFGLKKVSSKHLRDSVLERGVVIFQKLSPISRFSSIVYNDRYYLFIDNFESSVLLESQDYKNFNESLWVVFVIALLILLYMYISIFKSIAPLKTLSSQIRKFASGDLEIECKSESNDEIGEVANEFDRAVKKIHDLINSRQLFLRTIMHELKTPIGKGRIVAEMLEDETAKKRLIGVFGRLDLLISEFSKIEQITSKRYDLSLKEYSLLHVIDQAIDLLMLDDKKREDQVKVEGDFDFKVTVDFDLMALALKNLMDNAMKHSLNHRVYVKSEGQKVIIANEGEPLKMAIEEYFQPFVSGSKACGSGLGLGLYIVKNIVAQHGFEVLYGYEEGFHHFSIDFSKECAL
ncbi:ArsS family sensor histidine kinase [Sulfurospirillum multivorans]|uniref:histidine kinase n=2 Tax=Sulfurospirillum multivorans TaxID=66821 RepID=A0AA86AM22_SULMK|nr:ArsS family sensor histidine kinase [Sulfurospirillum multivorans]AHJ12013.1 two-component system histidine kinase [Sulfurospirillum multivorans DSM 12446]QEH05516.1 two-component system histidine kinase [Sulfurospirillum multivorans]